MEILVNDKPYAFAGSPEQTVGELADEVRGCDSGVPKFVVAIRCNGTLVTDEDLDAILQTAVNHFDRIELHTQRVDTLVRGSLEEAIQTFDGTFNMREKTADLLAEGKQESAMQEFHALLQVFKQVQETVVLCAQAMSIGINDLHGEGQTLGEILEIIKKQLVELKKAMEQNDFVLVGDILRYEMEEASQEWLKILKLLRSKADSPPR